MKTRNPQKNARPLALVASLIFLASACATSPTSLTPHEVGSGSWQGTAALLNYKLDTPESGSGGAAILKSGCTLILRNTHDKREYSIQLSPHRDSVFFDVPAGQYEGKRLTCPPYSKWDLTLFLKGEFPILDGKINYLGQETFRFTPDNQDMVFIQGDQKVVLEGLVANFRALPSSWHNAIVNPFTGKPLTETMASHQGPTRMDIHTERFIKKGEHPSASTALPLQTALEACDQTEQKRFPYRLGTLKYTATYQGGKLVDLSKTELNSFSDEFAVCLDRSLRAFKPLTPEKIVVTVSL
jgi:hypothetical protein